MGEKGNVSAEVASRVAGAATTSEGPGAVASVVTSVTERGASLAEKVAEKSVDVAVSKTGDRLEDRFDARRADDPPTPDGSPTTEA
jgi:hypothetical protein